MNHIKHLEDEKAIKKLKELAEEIKICLFSTGMDSMNGLITRPMATQEVDEHGNLWFFSDKNSHKNLEIKQNGYVQLFYAHPGKDSYLTVTGYAEILFDRKKIEELWNLFAKAWFQEGKDDPSISVIRVQPVQAYYWNTKDNKMIEFIKVAASAVSGKTLVETEEGKLNVRK